MKIFNLPSRMGCCDPVTAAITIGGGMMVGGALSKPKNISAPPPRSYLGEMQDALKSQSAIQGQLLGLEKQYTPQYQELQKSALMGQMGTLNDLYQNAGMVSQGLQSQYAGMQMPIYGAVGQFSNQAYQQGLGAQTMGLYDTMQRQAQEGLDAGYGLTPEMQRQAQQSARAAMSARGLAGGNQGVAQEVLNSYALGQQRYQQSLANAQGAYNLGVGQFGQAMNTYGTPLIQQMQAYSPASLLGQSAAGYESLGAKIFQPESQYNAGVYGANQSNEMNTRMANLQAQSAFSSGLMSAGASIMGAGMYGSAMKPPTPACWVAREVYGTKDAQWEIFRNWLLTESPEWFCNLYLKHGEEFAEYISNKPFLKSIIKSMMNLVVVPRLKKYNQYA